MDELRENVIQITLSIKEGVGFDFVHSPIVVSCSLNGHVLESDAVPPRQAPIIDSELVWETEKRAFRSLRLQNIPLKVEVSTRGVKRPNERIGYLLLSLLAAKPRPSHGRVVVNHSWHRLLGVKPEGKSCNPQILLRLTVEDCNKIASTALNLSTPSTDLPLNREPPLTATFSSRIKGNVKPNPSLLEKLQCDLPPNLIPHLRSDGIVQVGGDTSEDLFKFTLNVQSSENLYSLSNANGIFHDNKNTYHIRWIIFGQTFRTADDSSENHKLEATVRSDLKTLSQYFRDCPFSVIKLCNEDTELGSCYVDFRKMIPSDSLPDFLTNFCNQSKTFLCIEICFIDSCINDEVSHDYNGKEPNLHIQIGLQYLTPTELIILPLEKINTNGNSKNQSETSDNYHNVPKELNGDHIESSDGNIAIIDSNENIPKSDVATVLEQMEMLTHKKCSSAREENENSPKEGCTMSRSDPCLHHIHRKDHHCCYERHINENDGVKHLSSAVRELTPVNQSSKTKENLTMKVVNELEEWKEKQQLLFKSQLKFLEQSHLEMLTEEWEVWRSREMREVEHARSVTLCLKRTADSVQNLAGRLTRRLDSLHRAKEELDSLYNAKYRDLSEASKRMEDDFNHQTKLHQLKYSELEVKHKYLETANISLKETVKMRERELHTIKSLASSHDKTDHLIQQKAQLEEKLQKETESKLFFKEQWSAALKEIHYIKLQNMKQPSAPIYSDRRQFYQVGLEQMLRKEESLLHQDHYALQKLKDDIMSND